MDHQELIERLRGFEIDHSPDGWPAIRMREISAMCDAIESLLSENERLKVELAKYLDAPVVAWQWLDTANFRSKLPKNADRSEWNQLIIKPGEMK